MDPTLTEEEERDKQHTRALNKVRLTMNFDEFFDTVFHLDS